jgi:hypothetical protein
VEEGGEVGLLSSSGGGGGRVDMVGVRRWLSTRKSRVFDLGGRYSTVSYHVILSGGFFPIRIFPYEQKLQ